MPVICLPINVNPSHNPRELNGWSFAVSMSNDALKNLLSIINTSEKFLLDKTFLQITYNNKYRTRLCQVYVDSKNKDMWLLNPENPRIYIANGFPGTGKGEEDTSGIFVSNASTLKVNVCEDGIYVSFFYYHNHLGSRWLHSSHPVKADTFKALANIGETFEDFFVSIK